MSGRRQGEEGESLEAADSENFDLGLSELLDYPEEGQEVGDGEVEETEAGISGEPSEPVEEPLDGESSEAPQDEALQDDNLSYIKLLEERLNKMEGLLNKPETPETPPQEHKEFDPLEGVDFDEAMTSKEIFQGILQKVVRQTRESVMAELSPVMQDVEARKVVEVQKAANSFYEQHPDLSGFKKTVVSAVQEVLAESPHLEQGEVLKKAANLARTALGLPDGGGKASAGKKPSPALASPQRGAVRGGQKGPELSKVEQDILDLIL